MDEKEYNLLDEKWIRVLTLAGNVEYVGLKEVFNRSSEIERLLGDTAPQDVSILRLMLAVMYCAYLRDRSLSDSMDAMDLWSSIWEEGRFDETVVGKYLEDNREGFFLFHPTRPFYQTHMEGGSQYPAYKFNGSLSESNNKPRLFASVSGDQKDTMSYADAARWTVCAMSYDDCSAKHPSPKMAWGGNIGAVVIEGNNLFRTLMMNFPLADHRGEPYAVDVAPWEVGYQRPDVLQELPIPISPVGLLTIQCRHMELERVDDKVTGVRIKAGAFIPPEDVLVENMTSWIMRKDTQSFYPKKHDSTKSIWRDYQSLLLRDTSEGARTRVPGTIMWLSDLREFGAIPRMMIRVRAVGVEYGSMNSSIAEIIDDGLSINSELLSELNMGWNKLIDEMVKLTESVVYDFSVLMDELAILDGRNDVERDASKKRGKREMYGRMDAPFRSWLYKIDPESDRDSTSEVWKEKLEHICIGMADESLENSTIHSRNSRYNDSDNINNAYKAVDRYKRKVYSKTRWQKQ